MLFERKRKNCVATMEANTDEWCLLYQDALAQLWGRRSLYDDSASGKFLPVSERHISDDVQEDTVAWPGFPTRERKV